LPLACVPVQVVVTFQCWIKIRPIAICKTQSQKAFSGTITICKEENSSKLTPFGGVML
jgi:hypothetical protein